MKPNNVLISVDYLEEWTNKLLSLCRSKSWHLPTFLEENDFMSYWKFYKELIPFLKQFSEESKNEQIRMLVNEYSETNMKQLEKYISSKASIYHFALEWINPLLPHKSTNDFELDLNAVANNIGNLIYQIKIFMK